MSRPQTVDKYRIEDIAKMYPIQTKSADKSALKIIYPSRSEGAEKRFYLFD